MELERIRAVLTADSAHFVNGMNRARGSIDGFVTRAGQSNRAIGIMRNGMVALATQAVGAQNSVGRLAQGLLMLGGGGGLVLGVAAGIGAISLAYKVLTRDTKEAEEAQKDLVKALQGVGAHGQLVAAQMELSQARAALGPAFDVSQRGFFGRIAAIFASEGQEVTQQEEALRRVSAAENAVATAAQLVAKWQAGIAEDAEREAAARTRSLMALDKMVAKMPGKDLVEAGRLKGLHADDAVGAKFMYEGMRGSLDSLGNKMRFGLEQGGITEDMRNFGISVGRQFAMGMLEGIESMRDLFKMILMSVLDFGIGMFLNSILPGAGTITQGIKGQVVGPAQINMNMNMSKLQPLTAFAIAKDPGFQQVIRESILVASSQGFNR